MKLSRSTWSKGKVLKGGLMIISVGGLVVGFQNCSKNGFEALSESQIVDSQSLKTSLNKVVIPFNNGVEVDTTVAPDKAKDIQNYLVNNGYGSIKDGKFEWSPEMKNALSNTLYTNDRGRVGIAPNGFLTAAQKEAISKIGAAAYSSGVSIGELLGAVGGDPEYAANLGYNLVGGVNVGNTQTSLGKKEPAALRFDPTTKKWELTSAIYVNGSADPAYSPWSRPNLMGAFGLELVKAGKYTLAEVMSPATTLKGERLAAYYEMLASMNAASGNPYGGTSYVDEKGITHSFYPDWGGIPVRRDGWEGPNGVWYTKDPAQGGVPYPEGGMRQWNPTGAGASLLSSMGLDASGKFQQPTGQGVAGTPATNSGTSMTNLVNQGASIWAGNMQGGASSVQQAFQNSNTTAAQIAQGTGIWANNIQGGAAAVGQAIQNNAGAAAQIAQGTTIWADNMQGGAAAVGQAIQSNTGAAAQIAQGTAIANEIFGQQVVSTAIQSNPQQAAGIASQLSQFQSQSGWSTQQMQDYIQSNPNTWQQDLNNAVSGH